MVVLPQLLEDIILLCKERLEVDQNSDRLALDSPTADANTHTLLVELLTPCCHK